jgi:membrane-associated phospholipid phosphatase
MRLNLAWLILFTSLALPFAAAGQTAETGLTPSAASPTTAPQQVPAPCSVTTAPAAVDRPVSWKLLLPNLISDQERIWSFPVRLMHGQGWIPTAAVLGTAAGLVALDPHEAGYFRHTSTFHGFNSLLTGTAMAVGPLAVPVSLYAIGRFRKDSKMQNTALLAAEAVADAEIVTTIWKRATSRTRPSGIATSGNFSDSWFEGSGAAVHRSGSFPSGHTITAFSIATVVARRYGNHRWVPYAAYGMAALVGFSRLTQSAHYLSDVFMGGALGYSIGRFTVLRQ